MRAAPAPDSSPTGLAEVARAFTRLGLSAFGGPVAHLGAAAALVALGSVAGDAGQPYLTRSVGVNLAFGLGSLLPLPSLDGQILWRELRRRWR